MLRPMLAGVLSILLVAGIVGLGIYVATDEPSAAPEETPAPVAASPAATGTPERVEKLPAVKIKSLTAAAKAAGCTVSNPPEEGTQHETKDFTAPDYRTNPPTSGNHAPDW